MPVPCGESSVKIPKVRASESFWAGEHVEVLGGWWATTGSGPPPRSRTPSPVFPAHPALCSHTPGPVHLVCLDVHLYPLSKLFIVNWWKWVKCFSESCELLCKLIESVKEGHCKLWSTARSTGNIPGLWLASEEGVCWGLGAGRQSCGTWPSMCGIWRCLQCQNWIKF